MKKIFFDEIKKSLKTPNPLNPMESIIHVKQIKQRTSNGTQSVKKSHELSQELVEYYKMQSNEKSDFIHMNSEQYNSPNNLEKNEDFFQKSKATVPSYLNSLLITAQSPSNNPIQINSYQEQFNKTFNAPQSQQGQFQDLVIDSTFQRKTDNTNYERRKVIIKKIEQKKHTNEILTALAQNRLINIKPRLRTESVGFTDGSIALLSNQRSSIRCSTQPNEKDIYGQEYLKPNFENSIIASNFNSSNSKNKQIKDKLFNRSMENSPLKKHNNYFMKIHNKKNQYISQKSPSFDLQNLQCMSQEYILKNENPSKIQQQASEEKQPFKLIHERQLRLSQPDMYRQRDNEFPVDEYLKTIKLQNKLSTQNMSSFSDYPIQDNIMTRPNSRVQTSMSPEKTRNESPLTKRMASIKRNNKIQHNTILSQKNSIILDNLNSSLFTTSQDLTFQELVDNTHIQNQAKYKIQQNNHNWINSQQSQPQQERQLQKQYYTPLQFTINIPKRQDLNQSIEQFDNQQQQIFQKRNLIKSTNKTQNIHQILKQQNQLQNFSPQFIKL